MEELRDQSCISPICEDINAALRIDDATPGDTGDVCVESYSNTVGGAGDGLDPCSMDDHDLSPKERRRRRDRARRAAMSPRQRAAINKRRRDSYVGKRLFMTPEKKKEKTRQSKRDYRKRAKEQQASNLHPDSITMPSPHFTLELVFPLPDKSPSRISDELEIPLVNGRPVYIQSSVEQSPGVITPQPVPANHTIHSKPVTPGIRNSRLNWRNQMFEATIGRNTKWPACEKFNYTSQPTQTSCVMDNSGTQTDARDSHPFTASNVFGAGIQTLPSVVDEPYSMPPHGGQAETHASMEEDDCDENIIFEDDEEEDEGYLFGGQEPDDWEADEDVDLETANEDPNEPDVPDPYDAVYANVLDVTRMLKLEDNCEHCNAKKFESEPPGF
nr:uncharacterized protein LOC117857244 isoform X2 [Setaria viridis]